METKIEVGHFYVNRHDPKTGIYRVLKFYVYLEMVEYQMIGSTIVLKTDTETFLKMFSYYNP